MSRDPVVCVECEEVIPPARVEARPSTRICVECQENKERSGGFARTRMGYSVKYKNDEVESMESYLVRGSD